jgi:hypothetical protein
MSLLMTLGRKMMAAAAEPSGPVSTAQPQPAAVTAPRRRWLPFEIIAEARAIVRMFVDPRYRLSWGCRIGTIVLLIAIAASSWLLGPLSAIPYLDKVVDLCLAFVLFKVIGQEANRYRLTAPDLPPSLRL